MRIIYSENGTHHLFTQTAENTFKRAELESPLCAIQLQYFDEIETEEVPEVLESSQVNIETENKVEPVTEIAEEVIENDYPGFEDTIAILSEETSEEETLEASEDVVENEITEETTAEETVETNEIKDIQSQITIELESPMNIEEDEIQLPVNKYLTSLNIQMVANVFEEAQKLSELFHKDRIQFVQGLHAFIDNQTSQSGLKFIFTDVLEKKVKEEIKVTVKTKTCEGLTKEHIKEATEIDKNIFTAYNVKNEAFSILGFKEETQEYFGCFHLDNVNFLFMFKQLNELNKLQINILKSFATCFNHLIQEKRKVVKKRKSENKVKVPANAMAAPPVSNTIQ
jgi:hypothetical protein